MPEIIALLRQEMAQILRRQAESDPNPSVRKRLLTIADVFETGQFEDLD